MKFKKQRSFIVNSSSARLCEPTPKADRIAKLRAKLYPIATSVDACVWWRHHTF